MNPPTDTKGYSLDSNVSNKIIRQEFRFDSGNKVALSNTYEVDEKENKLNSVTNANKENEDLKIGISRKGIMFKVVDPACNNN